MVVNTIDQLKSNPLYWASLGSRELFHSNFLGWLFEKYPSSAKVILNDDIEGFEVLREKHNIDLVLKSSTYIIAIENKFKDVPKAEQLNKYTVVLKEKYKSQSIKKILLTLMSPSEEAKGWETVLYHDLARRLQEWVEESKTKICARHIIYIEDYIRLVIGIVEILSDYEDQSSYWFELDKNDNFKALKNIRFQDTVMKNYASKLHQDIKIFLNENCNFSEYIVSNFGMHNKQAAVHFSISTASEKNNLYDSDISLGVSIQGKTYRRVIGKNAFKLKDHRTDESIISTLCQFEKEHNFNSSDWLPEWSGTKGEPIFYDSKPHSTKMTKLYGSYKPAYIYRYIDIGGSSGIKIEDIKHYVETDMRLAKKLIEKIKT